MNPKAEEIRQKMLRVRTDIDDDVDELMVAAKTFVDWKTYVRSAPWATAGLAVALGFLVVPTKKNVGAMTHSFGKLEGSEVVANVGRQQKPSLLTNIAGNLAATILRLAVTQLGRQATSMLAGSGGGAANPRHSTTAEDSARKDNFQDSNL